MSTRPRIPLRVLFGLAGVFSVSSTVQAYWLSRLAGDTAATLPHLIVINTVYWYVPALLAPSILALATRHRFGTGRWAVPLLVHLTGAFAYSLVHSAAIFVTAHMIAAAPPSKGWWLLARVEYLQQLDWLLMTYLFLVGLAHALVYRRDSERRALDAAHLEMRLVEAQLQALQRQLHPHFLFNTLNAIAGLMRTDVDAADRMMDRLGDLLRMTLTSNVQEVPLRQELEMLQKYLDIEQVRFGSRLAVSMHIDADALGALVPNLLLQPLVENAVRHGISPHARAGRLVVTAVKEGDRLRLTIQDNGDGVPPHRLTLLNQGVGLGNTRARLERLYRDDHQLSFSNIDGGFLAVVNLPFSGGRRESEAVQVGAA